MHINSIGNGIQTIAPEGTSSDSSKKASAGTPRPPETQATLSAAPKVEALVAHAMQASPARHTKVAELKSAVSQGNYSVEPKQIAAAMTKELAG